MTRCNVSVFIAAAAAVAVISGRPAEASVITIGAPVADASINKQTADPAIADNNYGGNVVLNVRGNGTNIWKSYLRFGLSSVSSVSSITSMDLTLTCSNSNATTTAAWPAGTVVIYGQRDIAWGEGTGTTAAPVADTTGATITWNHAPDNDTASTSGFLSPAVSLGNFTPSGTGAYTFSISGSGLATLLSGATSASTITLMLGSTTGTFNAVVGSKSAGASYQPSLAVTVPEPFTMGLSSGVLGLLAMRRRRVA